MDSSINSISTKFYRAYFILLKLTVEIQDTLADDASGSSDDDYVDFEAEE